MKLLTVLRWSDFVSCSRSLLYLDWWSNFLSFET